MPSHLIYLTTPPSSGGIHPPLSLCARTSLSIHLTDIQSTSTVPSLTKGTQWSPKEPQSHHTVGKQDTEQQLGGGQ